MKPRDILDLTRTGQRRYAYILAPFDWAKEAGYTWRYELRDDNLDATYDGDHYHSKAEAIADACESAEALGWGDDFQISVDE